MEIHHYLQPAKRHWIKYPGISLEDSLGNSMTFFNGEAKWFEEEQIDIAILGVCEARNSYFPKAEKAPGLIRKWLYGMRCVSSGARIADIGDVKGNTLNDRYMALRDVVELLVEKNILVLLIGGTHDLTWAASHFIKKINGRSNIALVDAFLDVETEEDDFSASSFLKKLIEDLKGKIDDLTVMGTQLYYCSTEQERQMKNWNYRIIRLKDLRRNRIDHCEVVLRNATMLSFDFSALKGQPGLPGSVLMPNGFSNEEACRIFWYAGASDLIMLAALFNVQPFEQNENSVPLSAQMLWHFLEGQSTRCGDYPVRSVEGYELKIVYLQQYEENLKFYHNSENDRWWITVTDNSGEKIVPCHRDDYDLALRKEIPDVWWHHFFKTKANKELTKR